MSTISKDKTWADNENVTYTDLNNNFDTVYNEFNGGIDDDNIDAVTESKITFDTSAGHNHDGTNSKAIPKGFVFTIVGTLATGTSIAPLLVATATQTISKVYANVKTAPTGADLIMDINKNGTTIWSTQGNRVKVVAAATAGTATSFNTTSLAEGDILTLDIDQIGSTIPGADLTITIKA